MIDTHEAARRLIAENAREAEQLRIRRAKARGMAVTIARAIIHAHPDAGRVWGFGSVFEERGG